MADTRRGRAPFTQAEVDRLRRLTDTYGIVQAAAIAGATPNGIRNLRRRGWSVGVTSVPRRPVPNDFTIQSDAMTIKELARHYGAGLSTVTRWARATGRADARGRERYPAPRDLAAIIADLGLVGARHHYGVCEDTLIRWRREAGLPVRGDAPRRAVGWAERYVAEVRA